jgi:TonB-linked SusC/RagA family outer membrane protein
MKTKFNGILTLLLALVVQISFAQDKTISGTVSDESGPLPGVTVLKKGTTQGTETDFDGKYSIKAKTGDVLVYSFVGMKSLEKVVGLTNSISVEMINDNLLSEVVVTALGNKREKRSLTTSIQKIGGDDISGAKEANLVNSISGKVAGVQITNNGGGSGTSSRIVIRGASSLTGNNQPLFVVDGVPVYNGAGGSNGSSGGYDQPNGIADINPTDIQSMSVLKGPAAAALYGLRASNGVILITTKSGKAGEGFGITVNSSASFQTILAQPRFQNSYGQGTKNSFHFVDGSNFGNGGGVDESWGAPLDKGFEFIQFTSYLENPNNPQAKPYVSQPDTYADFFNVGTTFTNGVSFSGSSEDNSLTYRLSLNKSNSNGIIPTTNFNRTNITAKASYKANDKLTSTVNVSYIRSGSDNLTPVGYSASNPVQQVIWGGRNVDWAILKDYKNFPLLSTTSFTNGAAFNWNNRYQNNPYWALDNNKRTLDKDRVIGSINLAYEVNDWLTATSKVGTDFSTTLNTGNRAFSTEGYLNGSYSESTITRSETNYTLGLNANRDLTEDLNLNLNVGGNMQKNMFRNIFGFAPQLQLPNLYTLANIKSGVTPTLTNYNSSSQVNSLYFAGSLSFKNYLFLDFSGRNDWASVLPKANNSFFYPSASAAAVLTDAFKIDSDVLNYFKLRGSWAQVGSVGALSPYQINQSFNLSGETWGGNSVAYLSSTLSNDQLSPEKTTGWEVGFDSKLFNNKLSLNVSYYNRLSEDLLLTAQVSGTSGYTRAWENVGRMENKGFELQLGYEAYNKNDLKISFDVNFNTNKNEVLEINDDKGLDALVLGGQWGLTVQARKGMPYGVLFGNDFLRSPDGDVIYKNGLPQIDPTQKALGNITPDWTGGINTNVAYKGFFASALIDAKVGGDVHSMTNAWGRYAGVLEETLQGRETGIVGNGVVLTNGNYVANDVVVTAKAFNQASYSNDIHSTSVFDASFVKLREVKLGYNLPNKALKNTLFSAASISLTGRNLAILYKNAPHIDPESAFSVSNGDQGQEFGQIPSTSSYSMNLTLKF